MSERHWFRPEPSGGAHTPPSAIELFETRLKEIVDGEPVSNDVQRWIMEAFHETLARALSERDIFRDGFNSAREEITALKAAAKQAKEDGVDEERSRCARLCWSWGESWMAAEIAKGEEVS